MRLAAMSLVLLAGACHANPDATLCGQSGAGTCNADAGQLCVQEAQEGPQTCESTFSCWQPLATPEAGVSQSGDFLVASTWAFAEQQCSGPQPGPGTYFYLSATPCDGLVALMEDREVETQTALYAADGGALVALYQTVDLDLASSCSAGNVPLSASCLQAVWNHPVPCVGPDAGADSSDAD